MINPDNIRVQITLPKSLVRLCRKHHIRVSKVVREAGIDALNRIVERYRQNRVNNEKEK